MQKCRYNFNKLKLTNDFRVALLWSVGVSFQPVISAALLLRVRGGLAVEVTLRLGGRAACGIKSSIVCIGSYDGARRISNLLDKQREDQFEECKKKSAD